MKYKAVIYFTGGQSLTLNHLELKGDDYCERMGSFIDKYSLNGSEFFVQNYIDCSYLINRDNIAYVEILEQHQ